MTIKQFIEKAIEGGYTDIKLLQNAIAQEPNEVKARFLSYSALLDAKAWQAVGKVERWGVLYDEVKGIQYQAHDYMHNMIDALADGKTIEEFLDQLK